MEGGEEREGIGRGEGWMEGGREGRNEGGGREGMESSQAIVNLHSGSTPQQKRDKNPAS
jgi:hypothetical protein